MGSLQFCPQNRPLLRERFMFLIDDIILFPIKGIYHLARQVKEQAEEEFFDEAGTKHSLNELYMMLETGNITEEEFERREEELVTHLERMQEYKKR